MRKSKDQFKIGDRVRCVGARDVGTVVDIDEGGFGCHVSYDDGDTIWVMFDALERVSEPCNPMSLMDYVTTLADDFGEKEAEIGNVDRQVLTKGFFHGAKEMLRWRTSDEPVPKDVQFCVVKYKDFDDCTLTRLCEWDGENFTDYYDDSVIRPIFYYPIPPMKLSKNSKPNK